MNNTNVLESKPAIYGQVLKLDVAIDILGADRVVSIDDSINVWARKTNLAVVNDTPVVRYYKTVLKQCAKENNRKLNPSNWHLIYLPSISLIEMLKVFDVGPRELQPSFTKPSEWIDRKAEAYWTTEKIISGYHLINLMPNFPGVFPKERSALFDNHFVQKLRPATAAEFVCAYFTKMMASPETAHHHRPDYYHLSTEVTAKGRFVAVGNYRTVNGLDINNVSNVDPKQDKHTIHGTATILNFNL